MSDQIERPISESGEEPTTNIRRIGAKDRKTRLASGGLIFPPETPGEIQAEASSLPAAPALPAKPRSVSRRRKRRGTWGYNFLTLMFLLATLTVIAYVAFLWQNYQSPLNPFAPPTPLPIFVTATPES